MSAPLPFTKMHGCANDYVVVNATAHPVADPAGLARAVCDRRRGVGADGLLLVSRADDADFRMRMFNVDGSEAEMCGNGLRCATRFALAQGLVPDNRPLVAQTGRGPLSVRAHEGGAVVSVEMGTARVEPEETLALHGTDVRFVPVSVGNPHAVVFVADVDAAPVAELGAALERHARFPDRTNVEFVEVVDRGRVRQRTWERGCGETLACGTGACAVAAAGVASGRTTHRVQVELRGGALEIEVDGDGRIRMTGPATPVFDGVWPGAEPTDG